MSAPSFSGCNQLRVVCGRLGSAFVKTDHDSSAFERRQCSDENARGSDITATATRFSQITTRTHSDAVIARTQELDLSISREQ